MGAKKKSSKSAKKNSRPLFSLIPPVSWFEEEGEDSKSPRNKKSSKTKKK